jgi:hypothetical protein
MKINKQIRIWFFLLRRRRIKNMINKIGMKFHLLNVIITFSSRKNNNDQTLLSIPGRQ